MKKKILGIVLVCVVVVGAVIAGVSYYSVNRELKQQVVSAEVTFRHSMRLLAESLKDSESSSDYIAGMATSFCDFSVLDPTDGIYRKIGDVISPLTSSENVELMTAEERTQAAEILMLVTDSSETTIQLELLGQLTSLLR